MNPTDTKTPYDKAQEYLASVEANKLTEPVNKVTVPEPAQPTIPKQASQLVSNITRDTNGFITAQTEEAKKLKELQATYGATLDQGSLSDLFKSTQAEYGVTPQSLQELKDIQLQLTDMDTASELTKTAIQGAAGQTAGQVGREVTQEDREAAVRSAGLAARAAVIQGNIETANAAATQAVNIAYQDRTLTNQNLINQIEMLQGTVDSQTSQLLEQEKRTYEADLAKIQEVKDAVASAMVSGASQAEISKLTDPTIDDDTKIAMAQAITARGATQMRDLEIQQLNASIRASNASASRSEISTLLDLAEAGDADAIAKLGLTTTDNSIPTADEIAYARQFAATGTVPPGLSTAGVSFGKIAELAADLPKPPGTIVDNNTGIKPDLSDATIDGLSALQDLIAKSEELAQLNENRAKGITGGIEYAFGSNEQKAYADLRKEIVDLLARARTGAALTKDEENFYASQLPGVTTGAAKQLALGTVGSGINPITGQYIGSQIGSQIGLDTTEVIRNNFKGKLEDTLNSKLSSQGLSIYGYSQVNVGGESFTVGELITNEYGQKGRVNPDGTVTIINQ